MRTQDYISKKKQKLAQEIQFWKRRELDIRANLGLNPWPDDITDKLAYCRQEAAKRQKELDNLQTRTWRQINAGWGGF